MLKILAFWKPRTFLGKLCRGLLLCRRGQATEIALLALARFWISLVSPFVGFRERVIAGQLLTKIRLAVLGEMDPGNLVVAFVALGELGFGIPLAVIDCPLTWMKGCRFTPATLTNFRFATEVAIRAPLWIARP